MTDRERQLEALHLLGVDSRGRSRFLIDPSMRDEEIYEALMRLDAEEPTTETEDYPST